MYIALPLKEVDASVRKWSMTPWNCPLNKHNRHCRKLSIILTWYSSTGSCALRDHGAVLPLFLFVCLFCFVCLFVCVFFFVCLFVWAWGYWLMFLFAFPGFCQFLRFVCDFSVWYRIWSDFFKISDTLLNLLCKSALGIATKPQEVHSVS